MIISDPVKNKLGKKTLKLLNSRAVKGLKLDLFILERESRIGGKESKKEFKPSRSTLLRERDGVCVHAC